MHIVLLSGGSGKRLWPLSNDIRSKQFIPIFHGSDGSRHSMAQRVWAGTPRSSRCKDHDRNVEGAGLDTAQPAR